MIKIMAWVYIAVVTGTLGILMIRKTDTYFWVGVGYGILICVGYVLFIMCLRVVNWG